VPPNVNQWNKEDFGDLTLQTPTPTGPHPIPAQHCAVDERHTAGSGVTLMLIAVVLMYVILVAPGEILTFISQHLLSRYDKQLIVIK